MKQINIDKLYKELLTAGIKSAGCDSKGTVWGTDFDQDGLSIEIQDREDVIAVIEAHDHNPDTETVRRDECSKVGVTPEEMIFALWKKVMNLDNTDADALQVLIDQVNLSFGQ